MPEGNLRLPVCMWYRVRPTAIGEERCGMTEVHEETDNGKEQREIDMWLVQAYSGEADSLLEEVEVLIGQQSWPND